MKNPYKILTVLFLVLLISCTDKKKEEAEIKATIEKIETVEAEIEKVTKEVEAKAKELEDSLKELDDI